MLTNVKTIDIVVLHNGSKPIQFCRIREPNRQSIKFSAKTTGIRVVHLISHNCVAIVVIAVNVRWASDIFFIVCQLNDKVNINN